MPSSVEPLKLEGDGVHVFVLLLNDKTFGYSSTRDSLRATVASALATTDMKLLLCATTQLEPTANTQTAVLRALPRCMQAARSRRRAWRQALRALLQGHSCRPALRRHLPPDRDALVQQKLVPRNLNQRGRTPHAEGQEAAGVVGLQARDRARGG